MTVKEKIDKILSNLEEHISWIDETPEGTPKEYYKGLLQRFAENVKSLNNEGE